MAEQRLDSPIVASAGSTVVRSRWVSLIAHHGFVFLFFAFLAFFALLPVLDELREETFSLMPHVLRLLVFFGILTTVVVSISRTKIGRIVTLTIAFSTLVLWLVPFEWTGRNMHVARHVMAIVFIAYCIGGILYFTFSAIVVTFNLLCAALSVYLLFGIVWAVGYSLMTMLNPESFYSDVPGLVPAVEMCIGSGASMEVVYFSFATLTTLGYGDIVPFSPVARLFTVFEAVVGQLFLTVLVAQLVGMHIVHTQLRRAQNPQ